MSDLEKNKKDGKYNTTQSEKKIMYCYNPYLAAECILSERLYVNVKDVWCQLLMQQPLAVWHRRTEGHSFNITAIRSAVAGLGEDVMGFNGPEIKEYAVKPCGMDACRESNSTKYLMSRTLFLPKSITPLLTTKSHLCLTAWLFLSFFLLFLRSKERLATSPKTFA